MKLRPAQAVVLIAGAMLIWQLIVPPVTGMADNGDFGKLLGHFGMGAPAGLAFSNVRFTFEDRYRFNSRVWSSEMILIGAGVLINDVISKDGTFDIRIMGVIHGVLFLLALWLLFPLVEDLGRRALWVFSFAALLFFGDCLYMGYFNSFYMDGPAYLFTLLTAVFYLRAVCRRRRSDTIWFVVFAAMLVTTKTQYAVVGLWLAVLFWAAREVLLPGRKVVAGALACLMLLLSWVTLRFSSPEDYTAKNSFNVIFLQILPHSRDVSRSLTELGLDESYRQWMGTHAYSPGSRLEDPTFYKPFMQRTGYGKIGAYYLRHPAEGYLALRTSLNAGGRFRVPLGNFTEASGEANRQESQAFSIWSNLKRRAFQNHAPRLLFSFLALAGLVVALVWMQRGKLPQGAVAGTVVFIGMTITNLLLGGLADVIDPERHHLVFFAQCDMLLLGLIWLGMRWAALQDADTLSLKRRTSMMVR